MESSRRREAAAVAIQKAERGRAARRRYRVQASCAREQRLRDAAAADALYESARGCPFEGSGSDLGTPAEEALWDDELCGRALTEAEEGLCFARLGPAAAADRHARGEPPARHGVRAAEAAERMGLAEAAGTAACGARAAELLQELSADLASLAPQEQRRRQGALRAASHALLLREALAREGMGEEEWLCRGREARRERAGRAAQRGRALLAARVWSEHAGRFEEAEEYGRFRVRSAEHGSGELLRITQVEELAQLAAAALLRLPAHEQQQRAAVGREQEAASRRQLARATEGFLRQAERELLPAGDPAPGGAALPGGRLLLKAEGDGRQKTRAQELRERAEVYSLWGRRLGQLSLWHLELREERLRAPLAAAEAESRLGCFVWREESARALRHAVAARQVRRAEQGALLAVWPAVQQLAEAAAQGRAKLEKQEESARLDARRSARVGARVLAAAELQEAPAAQQTPRAAAPAAAAAAAAPRGLPSPAQRKLPPLRGPCPVRGGAGAAAAAIPAAACAGPAKDAAAPPDPLPSRPAPKRRALPQQGPLKDRPPLLGHPVHDEID